MAMQRGKHKRKLRPGTAGRDPALVEVIRRVGSLADLARLLGLSRQAVSRWRKVPAERLYTLHLLTGMPMHELRPDLFRHERRGP